MMSALQPMRSLALAAVSVLLAVSPAVRADCPASFVQAFDHYSKEEKYSVESAMRDFPQTRPPFKMIDDADEGEALTTVQDGVIRAEFPKNAISGKESGFTWYSMLPKQGMKYSMSYKVKFMDGFDWTKGGKLPGLCGGDSDDGSTACPVGCSPVGKDRGFSTRLMWRENGAIVTYAYYPDKDPSIRCGEDWKWSKKVQAGEWHHIRLYVELNTVDGGDAKKDGVFKAWLDGELVLEKDGIRYRYNEDFLISRAYLTTYCGGSDRGLFGPDQDQYIEFDAFEVWEGDCDEPDGGSIVKRL